LQRSQIQLSSADFAPYPHILGAGPLLIENNQIVLNAAGEQFNPTFVTQLADRSAIAQTADGSILLVATHNRIGGAGPSLAEWAALLQRMGAVNAVNLDGGSSTMLYLGGQLLDRHPVTATRVHNSIGVFLKPNP
jgi:exopolysaccharide biosynthesis protein